MVKRAREDSEGVNSNIDLTSHAFSASEDLLKKRVLWLAGEISLPNSIHITQRLLYLDLISTSPIHLFINSEGGEDHQTWAVVDLIESLRSPVYTYCVGICASNGSTVFVTGDRRFMFPHSKIMIHYGEGGGTVGTASDHGIYARQYQKETKEFIDFLASKTHISGKQIQDMLEKGDKWFDAQQAVKRGIADEVLSEYYLIDMIRRQK